MNRTEEQNNSIAPSRVSDRIVTSRKGRIIDGDERVVVTVLDLGLEGFGIQSDRAYVKGSTVTLEESGLMGVEVYRCEVVFCRRNGDGFQLGLHVLECQEEMVFSRSEDDEDGSVHLEEES